VDVTVVVDALTPQLSGIGRYTWELCQRLPLQPGIGRTGFFTNGGFVGDPRSLLRGGPASERSRLPRWIRRPLIRRRLRGTLVHGPNFFLPREADTGIVTIHDLSVFRFPETHPAERIRAFEQDFAHSLRRARHVITDSETVRRELVADFGVAERDITAIHLGVGSEYRPRESEELRRRLAPFRLSPGGYALCVSTLEPRKKTTELLRAWRELPDSLRQSVPLVLAGAQGWLNEELHENIRRGVAEGWLKHLGFVPEPDLPAIYSGASLFLYPSIYEGFGLPPVEAMASGVPTLVAGTSCLPEICGDAAGTVDPDDTAAFSEVIATALTDDAWRREARRKGLDRSALFSWGKCAADTADVYSRCPA
jgi:alpha-1,3-rhamnosyl/mannosyltransferase